MTQTFSTRRKVLLFSALGALTLIVGASGAYAYSFSDRALPNTTIAGHSLSGMKETAIASLIADLENQTKISITVGSSSAQASLSDLGVSIDEDATARAALERSDHLLARFTAVFSSNSVEPVVTKDLEAFTRFTQRLSESQGPAPVNAGVFADADGTFKVTEGSSGLSVETAPLEQAIDTALATLSSTSVSVEVKEHDPQATTDEAQKVADAANVLIAPEVKLGDGIDTFTASALEKTAWVSLPKIPDETAKPALDSHAVNDWVEQIAQKTNVAPIPIYDNVDSAGNVLVEEAHPGKSGLAANNVSEIASALFDAVSKGESYSATFNYDKVEPTRETRQVMAGYEGYAYPMAEGEKWIDIDLSANRLTGYEGQTPVIGPFAINHGAPGHETVTGLFHVYLQYASQDMGCTPDWPYCARDVPWVSYFTGSYAMHGAPWVSSFGRGSVGGSHGCVNLPVGAAHEVYTWATLGTPVASHY